MARSHFPRSWRSLTRAGKLKRLALPPRRWRRMVIEPLEERHLLSGLSLLFAGIDDTAASPTNAGLVMAVDLDQGRIVPLHAKVPLSAEGISGMTFRASGDL